MKKNIRLFILVMLVASILLAGGCTRNNEAPPEGPGTETPGTEGPNDNVGREEENIDKDLTEGLKSEAGVSNGRVYEKGDYVIATMMIEEGVSQGEIDQLAERYAQQIKEKYPDKKVNVQAVQGNENVANVTLD